MALSNRCENTGHYIPPRWTCCACYVELGNIGAGTHKCQNCGALIECSREDVPRFITTLVEADIQKERSDD